MSSVFLFALIFFFFTIWSFDQISESILLNFDDTKLWSDEQTEAAWGLIRFITKFKFEGVLNYHVAF